MIDFWKRKIKANSRLKKWALFLMMHPVKTRPRLWLRCLRFLYVKKGKDSVIYRSVRKDITPFNKFIMGRRSVIEDYSIVNNAMGDIVIGNNCRVGISTLVLGPIELKDNVNIAQHVVLLGFDHDYQDIVSEPHKQKILTQKIVLNENVWIGANSVILPGISVGRNSLIGAGSVVTRDVPPYCAAVGNPARIVKRYDFEKKEWVRNNI